MPISPAGVHAGVHTACLTPFHDDLTVDVSLLQSHAQWLLENGSDGILLFGTTGEGLSLTTEERIDVLVQLLDHGLPPDRLLVGTGAAAFPDLVTLTRTATEAGVGGVLVLPPFHFADVSDEGVHRTFDALIQRVGRSDLRLYFYHYPELSGVPISFSVIEKLRTAYPDQIAGVKDSTGEWDHTKALCENFPDLQIFAGTERLLLPALRAGGAGCISATANVTAPLAARVYAAWSGTSAAGELPEGDVDALQDRLSDLRTRLASFPMIAALKTLMSWRHDREDWRITRPPLADFPDDATDRLRQVNIALNRHV